MNTAHTGMIRLDEQLARNVNIASVAIQIKQPVYLWGMPGHVKTSLIEMIGRALAEKHGSCAVEVVTLSNYDPPDIIGWPKANDKFVSRVPPAFVYRLSQEVLGDKWGILFLDEMNMAPDACEAAGLRLVNERRSGDTLLGSNVAIAAAGNNGTGGATNRPLGHAMASRMCHIKDFHISEATWAESLMAGFPDFSIPLVPDDWKDLMDEVSAGVGSWVVSNPGILKDMTGSVDETDQYVYGYPNPRTVHKAAEMLAACRATNIGDDSTTHAVGGWIGYPNAVKLMQYLRTLDLPNPEDLLSAPGRYQVPKKRDVVYAVTMSVANAFARQMSKDRYQAAMDILAITAKQHPKDTVMPALLKILGSAKGMVGSAYGSHALLQEFRQLAAIYGEAKRTSNAKKAGRK